MWRWYRSLSVAKNALARGSERNCADEPRPATRSFHVEGKRFSCSPRARGFALPHSRESCIKKPLPERASEHRCGGMLRTTTDCAKRKMVQVLHSHHVLYTLTAADSEFFFEYVIFTGRQAPKYCHELQGKNWWLKNLILPGNPFTMP